MARRLRIFAPATVANLGPGFDVLGLALTSPGDIVEAELSDHSGVEIVDVTGDQGLLSRNPVENVAGRAAADVLRRAAEKVQKRGQTPFFARGTRNQQKKGSDPFSASPGIRLWVHKQMPLASGLGSSGASSAAAAVATNELLDRPLTQRELLLSAMEGERAASGTPHADNVAPSVMGGVILVRSYEPLEIVPLPVPSNLRIAVVHPHCKVSTAEARTLVKDCSYRLDTIVPNLGNIAAFVMALCSGDLALLGRSIEDRLVEPLRAASIPGFRAVKDAALAAGALGCSIAGSGPSVFAFASDDEAAHRIGTAMQAAFKSSAGLESDLYAGKVSPLGARVV